MNTRFEDSARPSGTRWGARPRLRTVLAAAALAGALALSACGGGGAAPDAAGDGGTVVMGNLYGFASFDPVTTPPPGIDYLQPVYDNLITRKRLSEFVPGLATEWSYDGVAQVLSLTLREGVTFTDGTPFDAAAVQANFEYGKNAATGSWADTYSSMDRFEIVTPNEIAIHFTTPQPAIIEAMASAPGMMVSPEALAAPGTLKATPVGTGPWMLDAARTVPNDTYTFTRNPDYWDPEVQQVDDVVIKPLVEPTTLVNALKNGQVDLIGITGGQAASLEKDGFTVGSMGGAVEVITIGDTRGEVIPALGDVRVRQAMGYALNRQQLLDATFGGKGAPSVNPFEEGSLGYSPKLDTAYEQDLDRAKQLMADAGYADGIDVPVYITAAHSQITDAVAAQLAEIGVRLQVNVVENSGALSDKVNTRQSPIMINALGIRSPWEFYTAFATPEGRYNPFGSTSPELEALDAEVRQFGSDEGAQAAPVYAEMFERLIYDDAFIIPVFRQQLPVVMRDGVDAELDTYAGTIPNPRNLSVSE